MPVASVGDLRINYEIRGRGQPLLCIGGTGWALGRSPSIFDSGIARDFETLAYDQRGMGQTTGRDLACTMADYAADANGLLDAVGWDRCAVIGISFGGMVAQEFALRYPQRVTRLVLACTSSGGAAGASYPLHELADLPLEEYARQFLLLCDARRDAAWQADGRNGFRSMLDQMEARLAEGLYHPERRAGALLQLDARRAHDTYDRLPQLRLPVFVCGGRYDDMAKPANLEAMQRRIPGAMLEFFEGGHYFFGQDPHAADRIAAFLRGNAGPL